MSLFNPFSLENKNIIITGASSGIGRQCAIDASKMGARVCLLGRNEIRLKETFEQLEGDNKHLKYSLDLNDADATKLVVAAIKEEFGEINGLIYSAGVSPTIPFRSLKKDKVQNAFETNVFGAINLTKLICKSTSNLSVVFISSVMASVGTSGKSLYGMTKGALVAGVKSLAVEYASKGYRFNCISPGVVRSPMSMNSEYSKKLEALEKVTNLHLLGLGQPEDIANAAIYLLSPASRWVTGTNLIVDGGYLAK